LPWIENYPQIKAEIHYNGFNGGTQLGAALFSRLSHLVIGQAGTTFMANHYGLRISAGKLAERRESVALEQVH